MNRISVFSSRKVNPLQVGEPKLEPLPPIPRKQPPVVQRVRTYTGPAIKPRWSIPLHEQGVLPYTPDELEELYLRREEEAAIQCMMSEGTTDAELLEALNDQPANYERCDACDLLFEADGKGFCPACGWVF